MRESVFGALSVMQLEETHTLSKRSVRAGVMGMTGNMPTEVTLRVKARNKNLRDSLVAESTYHLPMQVAAPQMSVLRRVMSAFHARYLARDFETHSALWRDSSKRLKHALVLGKLAQRTSPGSHHGHNLRNPEHVKGARTSQVVFPNAGGNSESGAFPATSSATVCRVSRSSGDYLLQARKLSDGNYGKFWFQVAEELHESVWDVRILSHVPWSILCASVTSLFNDSENSSQFPTKEEEARQIEHKDGSFSGISMHSGLLRGEFGSRMQIRHFAASGSLNHSELVISVGGRNTTAWEVAELSVWNRSLSLDELSEVMTYYHQVYSIPSERNWRDKWSIPPKPITPAEIHDADMGVMYCAAAATLPCMAPSGRVCSAGFAAPHSRQPLGVDSQMREVYHQVFSDSLGPFGWPFSYWDVDGRGAAADNNTFVMYDNSFTWGGKVQTGGGFQEYMFDMTEFRGISNIGCAQISEMRLWDVDGNSLAPTSVSAPGSDPGTGPPIQVQH